MVYLNFLQMKGINMSTRYIKDYDDRLMEYITNYTREIGVPPSLDSMIENVDGITSKSTIHTHLKKLVEEGLLVQKNKRKYYYPTSIDMGEILLPKYLLNKIIDTLSKDDKNKDLINKIQTYIIEKGNGNE